MSKSGGFSFGKVIACCSLCGNGAKALRARVPTRSFRIVAFGRFLPRCIVVIKGARGDIFVRLGSRLRFEDRLELGNLLCDAVVVVPLLDRCGECRNLFMNVKEEIVNWRLGPAFEFR